MCYVALFITDTTIEVAVLAKGVVHTTQLDNTDDGIDEFADWLRGHLPGESEPSWVATVPEGDGGHFYSWLVDAVPELLLQNPARLMEFASSNHANWRSAQTLLAFQQSKVW